MLQNYGIAALSRCCLLIFFPYKDWTIISFWRMKSCLKDSHAAPNYSHDWICNMKLVAIYKYWLKLQRFSGNLFLCNSSIIFMMNIPPNVAVNMYYIYFLDRFFKWSNFHILCKFKARRIYFIITALKLMWANLMCRLLSIEKHITVVDNTAQLFWEKKSYFSLI